MKMKLLTALIVLAMVGVASAGILVPNGDFETPAGANWANDGPAIITFPTTGGNGGGYGLMDESAGGGWGVLVSPDVAGNIGGGTPIGDLGVTAGTTATFTMDMINLTGTGIGGLKVEAWASNLLVGNSGDMAATGQSAAWATYTFDWAVPATTEKLILVPLWGAGSSVGYDNVGVVPEPATIGLFALAGGCMIFLRRLNHFNRIG